MNNIKAMRIKAGITQKKLAQELGTTQAAISQWETGLYNPAADRFPVIANILKCKIEELYQMGQGE